MTIAALLFALVVTSNAEDTRDPILLDFHAEWCGPCQQMRPAVEEFARRYPVKSIDIDEHGDLAKRYGVQSVPTFIVVDRSGRQLARTQGYQPAAELMHLYESVRAKARSAPSPVAEETDDADQEQPPESDDTDRRPATPANPDPWKTVVRVKIEGNGSIGFGSGTIIHSDADEAIILTCAHVFKVEGRMQPRPAEFRRRIVIDLFDGQLHSPKHPQVHYVESFPGKAIDYDFDRDVGLIRIRPGRRLPSSRVVPATWTPKSGMKMTTVGCSEGNDATAWSTSIVHPTIRGLMGNNVYEAIECWYAPKQGRSGGGLYTLDGYLAGVCDFAEPRGNHGLYATPHSIHAILDRNRLTALYNPSSRTGGALLAQNRPAPKRSATAPSIARAQSPEPDDPNRVTIPSPELLGIKMPNVAANAPRSRTSRSAWRSASEAAERTDLKMSPDVDREQFANEPEPQDRLAETPVRSTPRGSKGHWRVVRDSGTPVSASNTR